MLNLFQHLRTYRHSASVMLDSFQHPIPFPPPNRQTPPRHHIRHAGLVSASPHLPPFRFRHAELVSASHPLTRHQNDRPQNRHRARHAELVSASPHLPPFRFRHAGLVSAAPHPKKKRETQNQIQDATALCAQKNIQRTAISPNTAPTKKKKRLPEPVFWQAFFLILRNY